MDEQEIQDYFQKVEEAYGGKVRYKTFSTFFRVAENKVFHVAGLLCLVGNVIFFEDFQKPRGNVLDFLSGRNRSKYKKFKVERTLDKIEACVEIPSSMANSFLLGKTHRDNLHGPRGLQKVFDRSRMVIKFFDEEDWVVEPVDPKELKKVLLGARDESV